MPDVLAPGCYAATLNVSRYCENKTNTAGMAQTVLQDINGRRIEPATSEQGLRGRKRFDHVVGRDQIIYVPRLADRSLWSRNRVFRENLRQNGTKIFEEVDGVVA